MALLVRFSGGARTSRHRGHFQVTEVIKCEAAMPEGPKTEARIEQEQGGSGGALTASQRCLVRSAGDQEICDRNVTEGSGLNK